MGQPLALKAPNPPLKSGEKQTQGTETSKYLEEEKTN
jgi:hypothetical protein